MRSPLHKAKRRTPAQQELLLGVLVGISMLVVTSLYALTLRYQGGGTRSEDAPRWSVLSEGVVTRFAPLKYTLIDVKDKIASISQAQHAQDAALSVMKTKIETLSRPATTTPETNTP